MVSPSKIFSPPFETVHCARVLHSRPNQSCTEAFIWNLYRNHISSAKYYLPVLLFPLVFNWRRQTKRRVWAIVKNYLQTTSCSSIINAFGFYFICILRRLNGRYVYSCLPFLPVYLAAQLTWWVPPKVLQFYATGIIHSAIESLLRQLDVSLVYSRRAQTFIFMLCSLVVLRRQQIRKYSGFWFIRPNLIPADFNKWSLGKRIRQSLLEMRTYLGIGLGLDLLNAMLRKNLKKLQLKSTSFMLSYIGIYKLIQCFLVDKVDLKRTNILAAFLSGSSFGILNRSPLTIMAFAVVIASQVLWQQLCELDARHDKILSILQRIPWAQILIPPSLAYLVHSMLYQRHVVNSLAKSFIDNTCDKNVQRIYAIIKQPIDTAMSIVQKLPIKPFLF